MSLSWRPDQSTQQALGPPSQIEKRGGGGKRKREIKRYRRERKIQETQSRTEAQKISLVHQGLEEGMFPKVGGGSALGKIEHASFPECVSHLQKCLRQDSYIGSPPTLSSGNGLADSGMTGVHHHTLLEKGIDVRVKIV